MKELSPAELSGIHKRLKATVNVLTGKRTMVPDEVVRIMAVKAVSGIAKHLCEMPCWLVCGMLCGGTGGWMWRRNRCSDEGSR